MGKAGGDGDAWIDMARTIENRGAQQGIAGYRALADWTGVTVGLDAVAYTSALIFEKSQKDSRTTMETF